MKLGMLCYGSDTGLGRQTELLYRLLKPDKVMLVDISRLNGMPVHSSWYSNIDVHTDGYPTNEEIDRFLDGIDTVFICESPLNYYLLERANQLGIRTVVQPNPEFFDYFRSPHIPRPSVFGLPSTWMQREVQAAVPGSLVVSLPVPVDSDRLPERHVTEVKTHFHIAGRPAANDRNGTHDFIQAARMVANVERGIRFILYCQKPDVALRRAVRSANIELIEHVDDYGDMYRQGDILVLPRKYGGLCLPAQEAVGSGLPVLMPRISPNDSWLPAEWLLDVNPEPRSFKPRGTVHMWDTNIQALAQRMLDLYRHPEAVEKMADQARDLSHSLSWETLGPLYRRVIEGGDA